MSNWQAQARYMGKAVGQPAVLKIEKTGTQYIEVQIAKSLDGSLIRYRGYINSAANIKTTVADLRAMGWRGKRLGDWQGFGSREFSFVAMPDVVGDRTYWRAAFIQAARPQADAQEVEALNFRFGDLFAGGDEEPEEVDDAAVSEVPPSPRRMPPPPPAAAQPEGEEIPF
jgi:hypothetical protein